MTGWGRIYFYKGRRLTIQQVLRWTDTIIFQESLSDLLPKQVSAAFSGEDLCLQGKTTNAPTGLNTDRIMYTKCLIFFSHKCVLLFFLAYHTTAVKLH